MFHLPPFRVRALRQIPCAVLLAAAFVCLPACGSSLGISPNYRIEFLSLATKTIPGGLQDDGDLKDVAIKDRNTFKPSKGSASGIDKRFRMKSKRDNGAACFLAERETTGDVSARVRVAIDSAQGLVDGVSLAFLERRPTPPGEAPVLRVEAFWNAAIDGFTTRFLVDGVVTGTPLDMPGVHDAHLYLTDFGSQLHGQAAEAAGDGFEDIGLNTTFAFVKQTGSDETARVAFGSSGLGKKGAFFFDQFVLTFDDSATSGTVEADMLEDIASAWLSLEDAVAYLEQNSPNVSLIYGLSNNAYFKLSAASQTLDAALLAGTLHPSTDGELLRKSLNSALAGVVAGSTKLFDLLQVDATSGAPAKKNMVKAFEGAELAIAHLHGFKAKTYKALKKAIAFELL